MEDLTSQGTGIFSALTGLIIQWHLSPTMPSKISMFPSCGFCSMPVVYAVGLLALRPTFLLSQTGVGHSFSTKVFNFDYTTKEDIKKHNPNGLQILDHLYRILIAAGSGSGKTDALFNLINHEPDIDKIRLYAKNPYETKYQLLINKRESTDIKYLNG